MEVVQAQGGWMALPLDPCEEMKRKSAWRRFQFAERTSSLAAEDVEHPDVEEKAPSATQEDKDDKEEEEEVPVDWEQLRCLPARPRGEPPCHLPRGCTERWEPVNLKVISSGRWWYVLPDWPPKDFDYAAALAARGYRAVPVSEFEEAADLEGELRTVGSHHKKVFALPNGYEGLYRDEQGSLIDATPASLTNGGKDRSNAELHELLLLAYTRQLEEPDSLWRAELFLVAALGNFYAAATTRFNDSGFTSGLCFVCGRALVLHLSAGWCLISCAAAVGIGWFCRDVCCWVPHLGHLGGAGSSEGIDASYQRAGLYPACFAAACVLAALTTALVGPSGAP
eukprot:Skav201245  [mRNA]  locus=scaffold3106:68129:81563:- [translate_table: standard]